MPRSAKQLGTGFPKHPLHKIVCIGAVFASRQPEGWRVDALGAPRVGERSEGELISAFVEPVGQLRPQLIAFNGHSFDLPVLGFADDPDGHRASESIKVSLTYRSPPH